MEGVKGRLADFRQGRWAKWRATMFTCFIRYEIEPGKLDAFKEYARAWIVLIRKYGGTHHGYFIPGESGVRYLEGMRGRGVGIKVLTNALAATDEPEVHAGYSKYRVPLLEAGVDLYELRPIPGKPPRRALGTSSGESLHAKSMVVDSRIVFVGSMNLDPRSRKLNTEMGVIVDSPDLAAAISRYFDRATAPENAYHVVLEKTSDKPGAKPELRWKAVDDGKPVTYDHDPETSRWLRFKVSVMRILPIEGML